MNSTEAWTLFDEVARRELGISCHEFMTRWRRHNLATYDHGKVAYVSMFWPGRIPTPDP